MKKFLLILSLIFLMTIFSEAQAQESSTVDVPILFIYPNPATTPDIKFKFRRSFERGYVIQIFNFLGKKMYEARNVSEEHKINISDFHRGLYIYQLFDKNGKVVESGKFQVSRSS